MSTTKNDPLWFKDAIIYELSVRAFYDSNGDGIGDFPGLIQKLDYLEDLGVNTIWLLPFYIPLALAALALVVLMFYGGVALIGSLFHSVFSGWPTWAIVITILLVAILLKK